jgi:8-oxo-dGTP pyrophosphatase MutT (NUDIX family)
VRQFRPAVHAFSVREAEANGKPLPPVTGGETLELVAGLCDKHGFTPQEVAAEEVLEEAGYEVEASDLEHMFTSRASVGIMGSRLQVFYVEVRASQQVSSALPSSYGCSSTPLPGLSLHVSLVPLLCRCLREVGFVRKGSSWKYCVGQRVTL